MDFVGDLQEISPEKIFAHRLLVLDFLDHLLQKYPWLQILYKPFPGTYNNDPIKTKCSKWIGNGRIQVTDHSPKILYSKVDIVLWDSISTGFSESIISGVPVILFNNRYEYELASPQGKVVNEALTKARVQCFDIDNALNSFDRIMNDLNSYRNDTKASIQMFMKDHAMPVSKKEWFGNFNQIVADYSNTKKNITKD